MAVDPYVTMARLLWTTTWTDWIPETVFMGSPPLEMKYRWLLFAFGLLDTYITARCCRDCFVYISSEKKRMH
jgi:hypothetical protein